MDYPKYSLPVGTVLKNGKYEYIITDVLGAGSFGITYKVSARISVENISTTVYFAVKEFFLKGCYRGEDGCIVKCPESIQSEHKSNLEAFLNEAHLLHDLSRLSKNIIHVNEVFESFGTAYYVMEFIEGGNLLNWVAENGPLEENAALSMMNEICDTVHLIHSNNLLHLDIKPSNIMLSTDSGSDKAYPVLVDFGLAKQFDTNGNPTSSTFSKGATDSYAPKEQYSDIKRFNPAIDVYALAATLYFLLTGKHPKSAFDIKPQDIINGLGHKTSIKTRNAIIKAMNPDCDKRTQSAELFIQTLMDSNSDRDDTEKPVKKNTNVFVGRQNNEKRIKKRKKIIIFATSIIAIALVVFFVWNKFKDSTDESTQNNEGLLETKSDREDVLTAMPDTLSSDTEHIKSPLDSTLADTPQLISPSGKTQKQAQEKQNKRHGTQKESSERAIKKSTDNNTPPKNDVGHEPPNINTNISVDESKRREEAEELLRQHEIKRLLKK